MPTRVSLFAVALIGAISIVGVLLLWLQSRKLRRVFAHRESNDIDALYREHFEKLGVEHSTFVEAWGAVATAFQIEPRLLRLADRFDTDLGPLDSWNSGEGIHRLEDILRARGQPTFPVKPLETIEDFVNIYCGVG